MTSDEIRTHFTPLYTTRLLLGAPEPADLLAVLAVHGDPETNHFNPDGPMASLQQAQTRLERDLAQWQAEGFGYWSVRRLLDETVIGFGGIARLRWRGRDVLNLYYCLTPSVWGQGLASELATEAVRLGRTHLPELPILARTRPGNEAAVRVAARAGLTRQPDLDSEHIVLATGWS